MTNIPDHIIDVYLPKIGGQAFALYVLYAHVNEKAPCNVTMSDIGSALGVSRNTVSKLNKVLEKHGLITIQKPSGVDILSHRSTEITTLIPEQENKHEE